MKKTTLFFFVLLLLGPLCFVSCKKDPPTNPNNNGQPNEVAVGTLNLGNNKTCDFQGRVVDETDNPVANVTITVGNKTAQTDANGMFVILDATVKEKLAYVKAQKQGYFLGSRSVIPNIAGSNFIQIQLMPMEIVSTISSGTMATVNLNGGASVNFTGQYVDGSGNAYTGNVKVAAKYLSPSSEATWTQMPGMLYAENKDGQAGALATYGMIVVELFGEAGQSLNLAEGSTAQLHMPVDPSQQSSAPATIPLWFFDEVTGYWIEEGSATLVDGEYVGEVKHFTFWNCDVFFESCVFNGTVTDNSGNPLGNAQVQITSAGMTSSGLTNSDGTFFTYLAANEPATFSISYGCDAIPATYTVGPYAPGTSNTGTFIAGMGSGFLTVSGYLVNCNNEPVVNGDIYISDGVSYVQQYVNDGTFNMTVPYCGGGSSDIYYSVVDYDQPYSYFSSSTVAVSTVAIDMGTVMICDTISYDVVMDSIWSCDPGEYMQITYDGVSVLNDSCVSFSYADAFLQQGFVIYGTSDESMGLYAQDASTTGTYPGTTMVPLAGEVIFYTTFDMDTSCPLNFTTTISTFGVSGEYIQLSLSGSYVDVFGDTHTVSVQASALIP